MPDNCEVFRGGYVFNVEGETSRQIDVVEPLGNSHCLASWNERVELGLSLLRFPDKSHLQTAIVENIKRGAILYTDSHPGYVGLPGYQHESVAHSAGEYVKGLAHTNGIESHWALFKRGYVGTYHYMSAKHLHRYADEFAYRGSEGTDNTPPTLGKTVTGMVGRRLTYERLTA